MRPGFYIKIEVVGKIKNKTFHQQLADVYGKTLNQAQKEVQKLRDYLKARESDERTLNVLSVFKVTKVKI